MTKFQRWLYGWLLILQGLANVLTFGQFPIVYLPLSWIKWCLRKNNKQRKDK